MWSGHLEAVNPPCMPWNISMETVVPHPSNMHCGLACVVAGGIQASVDMQGCALHAGMTDMATMWAQHLPAAAHSLGTLGAFPVAPSATFNPQLYGLQASQQ